VINDDPKVSADTRKRVLAVIRAQGYRPNLTARSLASGRSNVLAVVIPLQLDNVLADPYFSPLLHGIAAEADARDQFVMLSLSEPGFKHRIDEVARQGVVDGVIFSASRVDDPLVSRMLDSGTCFVSVGRSVHDEVSSVDVDNVSSARQATLHLLRLGHRRVATITGPSFAVAAIDRLQGYRDAVEAFGFEVDEDLIVEGDFSEASGRSAMRRLLAYQPDAVFAASDRMAAGALSELRSAGLRVPEDVALVGFDDSVFARDLEPPLTTVRQRPAQLGGAAVNLLLDLIGDPKGTVRRVVLPIELVVRSSCGAHLNHERKDKSATIKA
jgi:DNA-binding LacI/PurR family transcriptional regulator